MKIKTNIRAGQGSNSNSPSSVDTSIASGGGANAGGVNSNKPNNTIVYYVPASSRCVGL
jgi:hypothetical protein